MAVRNERMASYLLLGMVLGLWQCVGGILNPCDEPEDNTTFVDLYTSPALNKTLPCQCDITSDTTLEYVFKTDIRGVSEGKVALWDMSNCTKKDLTDRKEVTSTHFRLVFRPTMSTREISVKAKEHFNIRCSRQVRNTSKPIKVSTACTTHLPENKVVSKATGITTVSVSPQEQSTSTPSETTQTTNVDTTDGNATVRSSLQTQSTSTPSGATYTQVSNVDTRRPNSSRDKDIAIAVTCAVLGTVAALVIGAFCCIRRNRKLLADRSSASETIQPMTSRMTCSRPGESNTLNTDTAPPIDTSCRPLTGIGYESVDETTGMLNIPRQRYDDTYVMLSLTRDTTQGRVAPDACAIYDHSHPQEDIYHTLQREQQRQIIVDNIYNTTSIQP